MRGEPGRPTSPAPLSRVGDRGTWGRKTGVSEGIREGNAGITAAAGPRPAAHARARPRAQCPPSARPVPFSFRTRLRGSAQGSGRLLRAAGGAVTGHRPPGRPSGPGPDRGRGADPRPGISSGARGCSAARWPGRGCHGCGGTGAHEKPRPGPAQPRPLRRPPRPPCRPRCRRRRYCCGGRGGRSWGAARRGG